MNSLPEAIPDVDYLLQLETEELAALVLHFAKLQRGRTNGLLHLANYQDLLFTANMGGHGYVADRREREIKLAIAEAWSWLEVQGLLVTAPGSNGSAGFRVLSRRAEKMASREDVEKFARSRQIRKEILNSRIAETVYSAFMRGEFDVAAFQAMKAVEVAVREAGGYSNSDLGTTLMERPFIPTRDRSPTCRPRRPNARLGRRYSQVQSAPTRTLTHIATLRSTRRTRLWK